MIVGLPTKRAPHAGKERKSDTGAQEQLHRLNASIAPPTEPGNLINSPSYH